MAINPKDFIPFALHFRAVTGNNTLELEPLHRSGGGTNPTSYNFGKALGHVQLQFVWTGNTELNLQIHDSQGWSNMEAGSAAGYGKPFVSKMIEVPMTTVGGGVSFRMVLGIPNEQVIASLRDRCTVKVFPLPGREAIS